MMELYVLKSIFSVRYLYIRRLCLKRPFVILNPGIFPRKADKNGERITTIIITRLL
jgi:hypothetical protein